MNDKPTTPVTPKARRLAAEFQRIGADLAAELLPSLPPKRRAGIDTCRAAGATLRMVAAVDSVLQVRVIMEMLSADGKRFEEMAGVFVDEHNR